MLLKPFNILHIAKEVDEYYFRYSEISVFHFYDFDSQIELYLRSGEHFRFCFDEEESYLSLKQEILQHLSAEEE